METIKAGTRCECRVGRDPFHACGLAIGQGDKQCRRDAVRLVTVPAVTGGASRPDWQSKGYGTKIQRLMCAACAEYHEAKGA